MSSFSARPCPTNGAPPHAGHADSGSEPGGGAASPSGRRTGGAGVGLAYGKTILLGEHAVVYGHPAIAAPVPGLFVTVEAARSARRGAADPLQIVDADLGRTTSALARAVPAVTAVCDTLGIPARGLEVRVHDDIPHGHGFGSSAAWGVALVRALTTLHGLDVDESEELGLVAHLEAEAHGRASGVDAHAASAGPGLLRFQGGRSAPLPVPSDCTATLLVLDSGISASTYETVASVARLLEEQPHTTRARIDRIGSLTAEAEAMLRAGDGEGVGAAMNENHRLLRELTLSTPELDALVSAARGGGALGAKLSGGGRGGCVVALCRSAAEAADLGTRLAADTAGRWAVDLCPGGGA